ncbi:BTAD domain-containing putative transcriptional regulator [Streptomyces sp. NPDC017993]|uniref:AfsR/SARP family transcriptional regulator n=1 Tax=Streptomyces sp. NPDC017993 TaxID=3365027 RepID=UPI003791110E
MHSLSFRLLGPLEVLMDGRPLRLGSARQCAVLAMLLLFSDRVVSVDALTDAVWQGAPPTTARNQICICVTNLRKTFRDAAGVDDLIDTVRPGYQLNSKRHRLDLCELETSVALARAAAGDGQPAEAAEHFEHALSLWRGTALAGLVGGGIDQEVTRLTEFWLDINEEFAALQLKLGQHRSVVARLTALVAEHPLREQARGHLMRAHHLSGRRAAALEVYREGRRIMADELGIEPSASIQQLHRRVLQDADEPESVAPQRGIVVPRTETARKVPAQLPLPPASFIGRAAEMAALDELLPGRRRQGTLAIAVLSGVGGVGKSALAVHWANRVADRFPDGQVFMDMRGYDIQDQPVSAMALLGQSLTALEVPCAEIPAEAQERAALYRSVLDGKRLLIVLDNVRSLGQVKPLLPGLGECCVVITSREPLDELTADYAAARIDLKVMPRGEAQEMLAAAIGAARVAAEPQEAARLVELCGRLPLALRIAAALPATRPHVSLRQLASRLADRSRRLDILSPNDGGVRAGFLLSYRELSPNAARLFRRLGLLTAPSFAVWVCAALLDVEAQEAEEPIEELVDAQLLEVCAVQPGVPPRFRLPELLGLFAGECAQSDESEADREAAFDRAFGTMLSLVDSACQRLYGPRAPVHRTGSAARLSAGHRSVVPADAMGLLESERESMVAMVRQAVQTGRAEQAWKLTACMVPFFEMRDYLEDWQRTAEDALEGARRAGDDLGCGTMLCTLGTLTIHRRRHPEAALLLYSAMVFLDRCGHVHGRGIALRNLALCARFAGDLDGAAGLCRAALDAFEQAGALTSHSHALGLLAQIERERASSEVRLERSEVSVELRDEAIVAGHEDGSPRSEVRNIRRQAEGLVYTGELRRAEQACQDVILLTRMQGDRLRETYGLLGLGERQWRQNLPCQAEESLVEALATAAALGDTFLQARIETELACAETVRGARHAVRRLRRAHETFRLLAATLWEKHTSRMLDALSVFEEGVPVDALDLARLRDACYGA